MNPESQRDAGRFFDAYVECALWSSSIGELFAEQHKRQTGEDFAPDTPLDSFGFAVGDLDYGSARDMAADCEDFYTRNGHELADIDAAQAGHDFWLTRNGHGAGFWDRGLGEIGDRLTDAAHAYGSQDIYVGDDGRLYV